MPPPKDFYPPHKKPGHGDSGVSDDAVRQLSETICHLTKAVILLVEQKDCERRNTQPRLMIVASHHDEPMESTKMRIDLTKQIEPGFRRLVSFTPDEPVDVRDDGTLGVAEVVEGDSSAPTITASDDAKYPSSPKLVYAWVNADGALGNKVGRVTLDAHVGPNEVPLAIEIGYVVANRDATEVKAVEVAGVPDEKIPA